MMIKGTRDRDALFGTDAGEVIKGGRGQDFIDGRGGDDVLFGGRGADTFLIRSDANGVAHIADFQPGRDRVILEAPDHWWATYDVNTGSVGSGTTAVAGPPEFAPTVAVIDNAPGLFPYDLISV